MRAVAQRAEPGDVIGVKVRVDGLDQLHVQLADELEITVDLLQHRIDDQRLAAAPAGEQVGVGTRYAVEQLAEDHALNPPLPIYHSRRTGAPDGCCPTEQFKPKATTAGKSELVCKTREAQENAIKDRGSVSAFGHYQRRAIRLAFLGMQTAGVSRISQGPARFPGRDG